MNIIKKIFRFLVWTIIVLLFSSAIFYFAYRPTKNPVWGINFSAHQAEYLGLNPGQTFQAILDDLHPKKMRLVAYWEDIEPQRWQYNFSQTDELLAKAQAAGVKVTLVLGRKQPRWPECHVPEWYNKLKPEQQQQALLSMLSEAVGHFQSSFAIERWQIENEPFFNYGPDCQTSAVSDLQAEVAVVKKLDMRPVVITDSGEKGIWFSAARISDVFGTTLYRKVDDKRFGGQVTYPLPPAWYRIRAGILKLVFGKQIIDVELQAEPWFSDLVTNTPLDRQLEIMDQKQLQSNLTYAAATGLPEHYLWGAEWWYYMKVKQNHGEFLETVKKLINN